MLLRLTLKNMCQFDNGVIRAIKNDVIKVKDQFFYPKLHSKFLTLRVYYPKVRYEPENVFNKEYRPSQV